MLGRAGGLVRFGDPSQVLACHLAPCLAPCPLDRPHRGAPLSGRHWVALLPPAATGWGGLGLVGDFGKPIGDGTVEVDAAQFDVLSPGVHTAKLTQLVRLSREQYYQAGTADQLSLSVNRAIVRLVDIAFLVEAAPVAPAVAPMAGLLNVTNVVEGGEVATNLDVIFDLIATLEDNLSVPTAIVVDPLGWSETRKLKIGTDYNATLLGAVTNDTQQMLFSLPVFVNRGMTDYSGVIIDRSAIVTAAGSVLIATSEHAYFGGDGLGLRATWRFGHIVVRPERIGKFTILGPGS